MKSEIRKLTKKDNDQLMKFVKTESEYNLFIIGNIENFGYDRDFMDVYAEYIDDRIVSCVMRYWNNVVYYTVNSETSQSVIDLINSFDYKYISGKKNVIAQIIGRVEYKKFTEDFFAKISDLRTVRKIDYDVKKANTEDDLIKVSDLLVTIDEFSHSANDLNDFIKSNLYSLDSDNDDNIYLIEEEGVVISSATTSASNKYNAMLIGVATDKARRGEGIASDLVYIIAKEFIDKGKTLCLFYDNPAAGSIYKKIGFEEVGKWSILER